MDKISLKLISYSHLFKDVMNYLKVDDAYYTMTHESNVNLMRYTDVLLLKQTLRLSGHHIDETWNCKLIIPLRYKKGYLDITICPINLNVKAIEVSYHPNSKTPIPVFVELLKVIKKRKLKEFLYG